MSCDLNTDFTLKYCLFGVVKDTLKAFDDFKNKQRTI